MPGPTTEALLSTWEQGLAQPNSIGRVLALLVVASPHIVSASLAELSIGQRDALLLRLREDLFGSHVSALAVCSECGETLELCFDISDVRTPEVSEPNGAIAVSWGQYQLEVRLPNSHDLLVLGEPEELKEKRMRLLDRIVLRAECSGHPIAVRELPEELISAMERKIQAAEPSAEVTVKLRCQSCDHEWSALFDIGSFLWKEVDAWAVRLLREVHLLARAYGWGEADILSMSPWRRHVYLEMLGV